MLSPLCRGQNSGFSKVKGLSQEPRSVSSPDRGPSCCPQGVESRPPKSCSFYHSQTDRPTVQTGLQPSPDESSARPNAQARDTRSSSSIPPHSLSPVTPGFCQDTCGSLCSLTAFVSHRLPVHFPHPQMPLLFALFLRGGATLRESGPGLP